MTTDLTVILNLHGIGTNSLQADDEEKDWWLELDQFEAVLDLVRNQSNVLLTFDDGNVSDVRVVLPALVKRRLTAIFFVCSGRLDTPTFLSRNDLKYMHSNGMRIGSHGITHRPWRGLSRKELSTELIESRRELEDICGVPVLEAACPFGAYDRAVLRALQSAGYRKVYTSDGGWTTSTSWLQARNTVLRTHHIDNTAMLVRCRPSWFARTLTWSRRLLKQLR